MATHTSADALRNSRSPSQRARMRQWLAGRALGAVIGAAMAAGMMLLCSPPRSEQLGEGQSQTVRDLRVQRLQLIDEWGQVRAELRVEDGIAKFSLDDEEGYTRVRVLAHRSHARVSAQDRAGRYIASMDVYEDGPAALTLLHNGQWRVGMEILPDGPKVAVWDEIGRAVWQAP